MKKGKEKEDEERRRRRKWRLGKYLNGKSDSIDGCPSDVFEATDISLI